MKRFVINVLVVGALLLTACAGGSETSTEGNDLQVPQVSSATENLFRRWRMARINRQRHRWIWMSVRWMIRRN
jgi:hypothetical protein